MPHSRVTPYAALGADLAARAAAGETRVTLALGDVEAILRRPLPASARRPRAYHQWWRGGGDIHAWEGWLRVGWRVEAVDLAGETVTFARGDG